MADNTNNARELLQHINKVSFAMNDATLFLDTHPDNKDALDYLIECKKRRERALKDYADSYTPLTLDSLDTDDNYWKWINSPWPWQKGGC